MNAIKSTVYSFLFLIGARISSRITETFLHPQSFYKLNPLPWRYSRRRTNIASCGPLWTNTPGHALRCVRCRHSGWPWIPLRIAHSRINNAKVTEVADAPVTSNKKSFIRGNLTKTPCKIWPPSMLNTNPHCSCVILHFHWQHNINHKLWSSCSLIFNIWMK